MRIFITIEYFTPAYKAGGPVQSVTNMVHNMANEPASIFLLCTNKDLDGTILSVVADKWVRFNKNTEVMYATPVMLNKKSIFSLLDDIRPDVLFINGIYSLPFTLMPLLWKGSPCRKIISVRGMLHPGALSQKSLKKNLYLSLFRFLGFQKKYEFHATTQEERTFIYNILGKTSKVHVIGNFPRELDAQTSLAKQSGSLQMVSIALISPMKNIKLVLEALMKCTGKVVYDIYGPIKDENYWNECIATTASLPHNIIVNYKGALISDAVVDTLASYHCLILPSKSENFGHSLFEALSVGKPVITSYYTPWTELSSNKAGWNVDISNVATISDAIDTITFTDNEEYKKWSQGAVAYALARIDKESLKDKYRTLFNING